MESRLSGLLPSLEELRQATLPLQDSLGVTLDKDREERELALLLPRLVSRWSNSNWYLISYSLRVLYVVFTQAKAYAQVQGESCICSANVTHTQTHTHSRPIKRGDPGQIIVHDN